jgi:hypothetical protein
VRLPIGPVADALRASAWTPPGARRHAGARLLGVPPAARLGGLGMVVFLDRRELTGLLGER